MKQTEEDRYVDKSSYTKENIALRVNRKHFKVKSESLRYHYYKEIDHLKKDCYFFKIKTENYGRKYNHKIKNVLEDIQSKHSSNSEDLSTEVCSIKFCIQTSSYPRTKSAWYIDSGATRHMTSSEHSLSNITYKEIGHIFFG